MKKTRIAMALTALTLLTAGCGGAAAKEVNTENLVNALVSEVTYDDALEPLGEDQANVYFDIEDGVTASLYMGSGTTAEEVAVFTAPDEEAAEKQLAHVQDYLDDQADSFRNYIPEEAKRVGDAVLERKGKYVILCVSADPDKAKEIIEEAFQ